MMRSSSKKPLDSVELLAPRFPDLGGKLGDGIEH